MIIGLSGYGRSGKDSAAAGLVKAGFRRVAFADKLREVLYALNPYVEPTYTPFVRTTDGTLTQSPRVADVIDKYGWDGYKETQFGDEIRRLLQRMGTEAGRDLLGENLWVNAALDDVGPDENVVITDLRFPNEMDEVIRRGGYIVRIHRPGVGPANSHPSETALDDRYDEFDLVLSNDGTVDDLQTKLILWATNTI